MANNQTDQTPEVQLMRGFYELLEGIHEKLEKNEERAVESKATDQRILEFLGRMQIKNVEWQRESDREIANIKKN